MRMIQKAIAFLWSSLGNFVQIAVWLGAAALTAWAAKAAEIFGAFAPFSWVALGIIGGFVAALGYWMVAVARARWVRTKYDNLLLARGGIVDPLAKTFEAKRIYLNEFVLPSNPFIEGKTFIDCEIIGPANIVLVTGNSVNEPLLPHCDAVALKTNDLPFNAIRMNRCTFRGCSFHRVTFLISEEEVDVTRDINWLHWIGHTPQPIQQALNLASPDEPPSSTV